MDEIANAAGLSRQALYLRYKSKEDLFSEALKYLIGSLLKEARNISQRDDLGVEAQLKAIFETLHGGLLEHGSRGDTAELLEFARANHGNLVQAFEEDFTKIVADLLTRSGIAKRWLEERLSANSLAEHLLIAASGIKASAKTLSEYRKRLAVAVRLVTRSKPLSGRGSARAKANP